jgi:hypothetical protein
MRLYPVCPFVLKPVPVSDIIDVADTGKVTTARMVVAMKAVL